CQQYNNDPPTF
nr:immunoglobulin light chain junction region [Macaca mulatta]MOV78335.1 immunoglobulin light chain junction region [Macaca mulatta]MOV79481.1 immunoglobulin light chain junction region [Macaca mulatta]MOV80322.1 immunoglobulin light chain junction region [Macaca mulatta]MOV80813.1 immunoglobulin light chain junction region [Macaca mulatta]